MIIAPELTFDDLVASQPTVVKVPVPSTKIVERQSNQPDDSSDESYSTGWFWLLFIGLAVFVAWKFRNQIGEWWQNMFLANPEPSTS